MKIFLVLAVVIGFVSSDDLSDIKLFLQCCQKAINEGVPSIPIPTHNPLVIDDFVYTGGNILVSYKLGLTNNILYNLVNYTFPVLNASSYLNPEGVSYNYDIYWPKLNFTGNWEIDVKTPLFDSDVKGTYNIVMYDVDWWGIFNYTKPAQGYNASVSGFTLESSTSSVSVLLTGADDAAELVGQDIIEVALMYVMNHFSTGVADFLRTERFNGFWLDQPERLNALLQFCGLKQSIFKF